MSIREAAKAIEDQIISWRRQIHQYPELHLETVKTEALVASALKDMGIEVRQGVGGHGVVGLLKGEGEVRTSTCSHACAQVGGHACAQVGSHAGVGAGAGSPAFARPRTIALRADMDALPVQEDTGRPYASKVPGVMHACGHDGHVAMLLGAAKVLAGMRKEFAGNIKFIFQPGEEGAGGARLMIEDGCLDDPRPDIIFGAHLGSLWNVGTGRVGVKAGYLMAASDRFHVTVKGKGGHGAAPHTSVDPVVIAAHIVIALQTIVSRETNPIQPAVVTVGVLQAGTANNIIPESCVMKGTVRYMDKELGTFIPQRIKEIAEGIAASMRAEATVDYYHGYPPVVNDAKSTELLAAAAAKVAGSENVVPADPTMGGEDMAYYLEEIPGAFFAIGSGNSAKGIIYPNHHSKFDIDEDVLHLGSAVFVQACLDFLGGAPV